MVKKSKGNHWIYAALLMFPAMLGCTSTVRVDFPAAPQAGRIDFTSDLGIIHPQPEWRFAEGTGYPRVDLKQSGKYTVVWPRRQIMHYVLRYALFLRHVGPEFSLLECRYKGSVMVDGTELKALPLDGCCNSPWPTCTKYPVCAFRAGQNTYVLTVDPIVRMDKPDSIILPELELYRYVEGSGLYSLGFNLSDDDKTAIEKHLAFIRILKNVRFAESYQNALAFRSVVEKYRKILITMTGDGHSRSRAAAIQAEALAYIQNTCRAHPDVLVPDEKNCTLYLGELPRGCSYAAGTAKDLYERIQSVWEKPFLSDAQKAPYRQVLNCISDNP